MRHVFDYIRKSKPLLFLIIGGFIYHMLIILPSGSYLCYQTTCGIFFWGAHQHDAIWHLAIANLAFLHTPFIVPFFSGAFLSGYNYLMDLIVFLISRLGLSAGLVYFKILPLLWFFLLVSIGLVFCRKVTRQISFAWFFIFLVLFGGSFGYFLTLYHGQTLKNAAGMLSMQAGLTLANLQFAFSLVAVICLFIIFLKKQLDKRVSLMVGLLLFIIIGLKFYAGVISIFLVFVYYGLSFSADFVKKKQVKASIFFWSALFWTGCIVTSVLLFYNPLSSVKTGSALVASPFAIVHAMIEERSLIYLPKLVNARYYLYTIGWGPRLLAIELFSTVLFFLFNFGTRTAGLLYAFLLIIRKKSSIFDLTLFLTVVFAATLPVIFIQKGIWWNTIQFFYYATFIANYFTAKLLARLLTGKKMVFLVLVAVIVGLTIPENFDIIQGFNVLRPYSYIPQSELEALRFLKKRPSGVVFASPWEQVTKERLRTTPLYEAVDSGYVAAYSAHQLYYADSHVLSIIGVDFKKRQERITKKDCTVLSEVTYIYRQNKNTTDLLMTCQGYLDQHFSPIFNNSVISIYQQR